MSPSALPVRPLPPPSVSVTLAERLSPTTPALTHAEGLRLFRALARELDRLHAAGQALGHLDPAGIRFEGAGLTTVARLDAALASEPTAYTAPEVRAGAPATPASDVYSLAALLLEWLSGMGASSPPTPAHVIAAQARSLAFPESAQAIVRQGLETAPALRWGSARAMTDALSDALMGQVAAALLANLPRGLSTESVRPVRRGGYAIAIVLALALVGWFFWSYTPLPPAPAPRPSESTAP